MATKGDTLHRRNKHSPHAPEGDPEFMPVENTAALIERVRAGRLSFSEKRQFRVEREALAEIEHTRYSHALHVAAILRRELDQMDTDTTTKGDQ